MSEEIKKEKSEAWKANRKILEELMSIKGGSNILNKVYPLIKGTDVAFDTFTSFDYMWYLKWLGNSFPKTTSAERYNFEMTLHTLAFTISRIGSEKMPVIAGKLFKEWFANQRTIQTLEQALESGEGGQTVTWDEIEDKRKEIEDNFRTSVLDRFDSKCKAVQDLNSSIKDIVSSKYAEFNKQYVHMVYYEEDNEKTLAGIDLNKLIFGQYDVWELNLYDLIKPVYTTLNVRLERLVEQWIDDDPMLKGNINEALYKYIRGVKYLAAQVLGVNDKAFGNPELADKDIKDMTDEEVIDLYEGRYIQMMSMPFLIISLLDDCRAHLARTINDALYRVDIKN